MGDLSKNLKNAAVSAILGLLSGVVTCATLASPMWLPFSGIVFALFLSLYSWWWEGLRYRWRMIGFILVTTSAFWIAVLVGLFGTHGGIESPDFEENILFVGGVVGTALVALARYIFLSGVQNRSTLIWRVGLISLVGGVLGAAGGSVNTSIGKGQVASLIPVFMVWQGCIAPLLVVLFPSSSMSGEIPLQPSSPVPTKRSLPLPVWKKLVMLVAFVFLAFWLVRGIRLQRQTAQPRIQPGSVSPATK